MTVLVLAARPPPAVALYLAFVSFHAVFIHANFGASLKRLEPFLATPRFHHFHHAAEAEAIDRNFAVHLPISTASSVRASCPKHAGRRATVCRTAA